MAKKNGNGEGSRPRRRPDGRWEARYWHGEERRSVYGKTRKEAAERLRDALTQKPEEGVEKDTPGITLREFIISYDDSARHTMKRTSLETYRDIARLHLLPALGDVPLSDIRREAIQKLYSEKLDSGLSPARVKRIHGVLNSILNTAVRWTLLDSNPCVSVTPPRVTPPEVRPLSWEEARALLREARTDQRHYPFIALGVTSGARYGELAALRWCDMDLEAGYMTISRNLVRGKGGYSFDTPKTRGSRRTVPLARLALEALKEHRKRTHGEGDTLVFTTSTGRPLNHSSFIRRVFKPMLTRAGLPATSWHAATRHTATCLLLLDRVDPRSVCNQMGWSSVAFMMDTYARYLPGWGDAGAMDRILDA